MIAFMGFFGTYLFDGTDWTQHDLRRTPREPWLLIDIHDSDIATVVYRPAGPGSGIAYLGVTPRTYFEDEGASEPTNVAQEADGLAAWWEAFHPDATALARADKADELRAFLAEDGVSVGDDDGTGDEVDDADLFVEVRTSRFINTLGLPVPDGLPV
jgi:hypothetical protein